MTQAKEALEALDKLYSAALESEYRTYGDPDDHVDVVRNALQATRREWMEDVKKAAACLLVPQPGIADTIWYNDNVTLYEQLLGIAGVVDLTGDVEKDYETLTGEKFPPSRAEGGEGG